MNATIRLFTTAYVPVFDWRGPEFLWFYVLAMLVASFWSCRRAVRLDPRFIRPASPADLHDPFDAAYLAGGAPRAVQTAVSCLLKRGWITWEESNGAVRLVAATDADQNTTTSALENAVFRAVRGSKNGLGFREVGTACATQLSAIEARLAAAGLRPTQAELGASGRMAFAPMWIVIGTGVVKLFVGLSRSKPIGFLFIALIVSLVLLAVVRGLANRKAGLLTPAGTEVLRRMRERNGSSGATASSADDFPVWAMSIALLGPLADPWIAGQDALAAQFKMAQANKAVTDGGGCGTSSGCGSSCGGGGDGGGCGSGCGGCGGD